MTRLRVSADVCHGQIPCFAGLDAIVPCVAKLAFTNTPALSKPRTTSTTTTSFSRFRDRDTFAAYGTDGRSHGCCCAWVWMDQHIHIYPNTHKRGKLKKTFTASSVRQYTANSFYAPLFPSLALYVRLQGSAPSNHL